LILVSLLHVERTPLTLFCVDFESSAAGGL
jgi:hypothetical protein